MNVGAGEWIFATPEIRKRSRERDARFHELCRSAGMTSALIAKLEQLRAHVPRFLERCADEILSADPAVVGFTAVYSQSIPSAALATMLKARAPDVRIVFGGASCEGPMGPALLEAFAAIDVVVRGEAEGVLPDLIASLIDGSPVPRRAGVCFREAGETVEIATDESVRVPMDEVPVPIFDEYFERLERLGLARQILPQVPFETARGCWWGMKAHCTFCGLNGLSMSFRSKSPERVLDEVSSLALKHACSTSPAPTTSST
jgi:magnesium-protoporphyrin IX monomethyl ester (oxidative) cyclase